jgi:NarL family two-component system sensor histidine kinase YdfH
MWLYVPQMLIPLLAVILFSQQVNAQTRTQNLLDELAKSHRQLEAYAAQVEDLTLTNERQRMARELHDTLAQGLAGIILQLEAADSHLISGKIDRAQTIIRQAMTRARATLAESRQVIDHLRMDTSSSPNDLAKAINEEVEHFSTSTGIPVTVHLDTEVFIPIPQRDCACRAVAEALLNIARHAGASQVRINLVASSNQLRIEIRDNGTGFNPTNQIGQVGHYGLLGLRERTRLLGGTLEVNSAPLQGTNIQICLPLETEVEDD